MTDDDTFVVNSEREFMALDADLYPAIVPAFSGTPVSTAEMQSEGLTPGPQWFPATVLAAANSPDDFSVTNGEGDPDPLDALPDGRYHDGTYEWEKDGGEWFPLMAPFGMPPRPEFSRLKRVVTRLVPLDAEEG